MSTKSKLLKEAIADAKAVRESAMANARLALEEAFTPKLQSMISAKLSEEMDEEDEETAAAEPEMAAPVAEPAAAPAEVPAPETAEAPAPEEEEVAEITDAELQEIIAELEAEADEDAMAESDYSKTEEDPMKEAEDDKDIDLEELFSELAEAEDDEKESDDHDDDEIKAELAEAYSVINKLRAQINEVNLLNAKLLYTNNLFKKFNLNEAQKLKIVENFDRAKSLREVKLVFSTISENLNAPKKVFKESFASKATGSKSTLTEQIVPEKSEFIARMQKLANINKK